MESRRTHPRRRRGMYAILVALGSTAILGMGALAVDTAYMRLTQAQAQGVADAAAQAALLELRRTGSTAAAERAAEIVSARNRIGTEEGFLVDLEFGLWDHDSPGLQPTEDGPNAVRAIVEPVGGTLNYGLAPILGFETFQVQAQATAASRRLTLVIVQDSTHSWSQDDYANDRNALLDLLDTLTNSYGAQDQLGLVTFNYRYAYEYTPLTLIEDIDHDNGNQVYRDWSNLNVFSEAGIPAHWGCREYNRRWNVNNFNSPRGGCYPDNPRAYYDEWGTDHTTGLSMAKQMFEEENDPAAFNVLLVLTDGKPNYLYESQGMREAAGYVENRWREYKGPVPRTGDEIRSGSIAITQDLWDEYRVHTYVVSFTADDWAMQAMPTGQGYYTLTNDSRALTPMLQAIADSIPLTLVE